MVLSVEKPSLQSVFFIYARGCITMAKQLPWKILTEVKIPILDTGVCYCPKGGLAHILTGNKNLHVICVACKQFYSTLSPSCLRN